MKLEHIRHFVTTAGTYYIDRSEDWHDLPDLDARYRFYASIEKDLLNLIDDLAAQGGDIEGIFNNPQIQAARQSYIQFLIESGKLTKAQAEEVANEVDANKKKEIQAARDARKAAQEAAAARLAEIRLIKEHNQVMLSLNHCLLYTSPSPRDS